MSSYTASYHQHFRVDSGGATAAGDNGSHGRDAPATRDTRRDATATREAPRSVLTAGEAPRDTRRALLQLALLMFVLH